MNTNTMSRASPAFFAVHLKEVNFFKKPLEWERVFWSGNDWIIINEVLIVSFNLENNSL